MRKRPLWTDFGGHVTFADLPEPGEYPFEDDLEREYDEENKDEEEE